MELQTRKPLRLAEFDYGSNGAYFVAVCTAMRMDILGTITALPEIVRQLTSFSARNVNRLLNTPGRPLWQRGYYERVLRGEDDLNAAAAYIQNNPARWAEKYPYLTE